MNNEYRPWQVCQLCKLRLTVLANDLKAIWVCDRCLIRGNGRALEQLGYKLS